MATTSALHVADYVVMAVMLLVPLGIGIYFAIKDRGQSSRDVYLLGGGTMSWFPVALSIFVTYQSAVALMGVPSEIFYSGAMFFVIYIGISLSYVLGYFTIVPLLGPLRLTSINEYLERRYQSRAVRTMAALLGMLMTTCYMAVSHLSPALALQAAVGMPLWMSVAIVGLVGTAYTAMGGIKSVVWTDAFQTVVIFIGILMIIIKGSISIGGFTTAISVARSQGRLSMEEWSLDPRTKYTWWGMTIGGTFTWLVNVYTQATVQRISAMKNMRDVKRSFLLNIPLYLICAIFLLFVGVVTFAYFHTFQCEPFASGEISSRNQIMPYFIRHAFADTPGVMGFYVATLFSASLSTVSSGINSLAANTVEDILSGPLSSVKEHRVTQITKLIVCVYGAITVGLAYVANNMKGSVSQMALSVMGATGGPILGVFLVGASVPWINKYGVLGGGCLSIAFSVWIALGNQVYSKKSNNLPFAYTGQCEANITCPLGSDGVTCDTSTLLFTNDTSFHGNYSVEVPTYTTTSPYLTTNGTVLDSGDFGFFLYDISYVWYALIGAVVSSVGAMAISFVSRKLVEKKTDPALMFPFSRKLWSMNVSKPTEEETEKSLATKDTVI